MATKERAKPRKREPRPKQQIIPEHVTETIEPIDRAASKYFDLVRERMDLGRQEVEAKANLILQMQQAKQKHYITPDGLEVNLLSIDKVKVSRPKDEENGDGEE